MQRSNEALNKLGNRRKFLWKPDYRRFFVEIRTREGNEGKDKKTAGSTSVVIVS